MKKIVIILVMTLLSCAVEAQTTAEWTRQKKTQRKYLLQQIAALKVYTGYVSKGYSVAKNGLNVINRIKEGDFTLHKTNLEKLSAINPTIRRYTKIAAILSLQKEIAGKCARSIRQFKNSRQFTPGEINYINDVCSKLLSDCADNLDKLLQVINNGRLNMTDDERIAMIDSIYTDLQDKQIFVRSFCGRTTTLMLQRQSDLNDITISKKLNALP